MKDYKIEHLNTFRETLLFKLILFPFVVKDELSKTFKSQFLKKKKKKKKKKKQ